MNHPKKLCKEITFSISLIYPLKLSCRSPSPTCKALLSACDSVQSTVNWQNSLSAAQPLRLKLAQLWNVTVENVPLWMGLYDNFYCRTAQGLAFPSGLTPEIVSQVRKISPKIQNCKTFFL